MAALWYDLSSIKLLCMILLEKIIKKGKMLLILLLLFRFYPWRYVSAKYNHGTGSVRGKNCFLSLFLGSLYYAYSESIK